MSCNIYAVYRKQVFWQHAKLHNNLFFHKWHTDILYHILTLNTLSIHLYTYPNLDSGSISSFNR